MEQPQPSASQRGGAIKSLAGAFVAATVLAGFAGTAVAQGHKIKVLATFLPVYCFTANVAGDLADVDHLLPVGAEPHDFQFTPREMRKLEAADVVVLNGLGIESWLDRAIESAGGSKELVRAGEGLSSELIPQAQYITGGEDQAATKGSAPNPHIWLDPRLAAREVTNIAAALEKADPANSAGYEKNAQAYLARLAKLDADLAAELAPLKGRSIITSHDAFPYFARRYRLRIAGVIEPKAEVVPSLRYLDELEKTVKREGVAVIFGETESSPKLAGQIGADCQVPVAILDTIETGDFSPGAYEEGMRKDGRIIEEALK
jgi:zinc transport system substrate-binding protein